jgi:hypothetical protein
VLRDPPESPQFCRAKEARYESAERAHSGATFRIGGWYCAIRIESFKSTRIPCRGSCRRESDSTDTWRCSRFRSASRTPVQLAYSSSRLHVCQGIPTMSECRAVADTSQIAQVSAESALTNCRLCCDSKPLAKRRDQAFSFSVSVPRPSNKPVRPNQERPYRRLFHA